MKVRSGWCVVDNWWLLVGDKIWAHIFEDVIVFLDTIIFIVDRPYKFGVKIILHSQEKLKFTLIWFLFKTIGIKGIWHGLSFILPIWSQHWLSSSSKTTFPGMLPALLQLGGISNQVIFSALPIGVTGFLVSSSCSQLHSICMFVWKNDKERTWES